MLQSTLLLTLAIATAAQAPETSEAPIPPDPNHNQLIERIVATGGDAEHHGGVIILVVLRGASDKDFDLLKDLKGVKYIDCAFCKMNGAGLANLIQMKRLETLWLHDNELDPKHLKHLSNLPKLHTLWLENTPTTDCSLRQLRNLKALKRLYLAKTKVTDDGLKHLQDLKNLTDIDLRGTKVTAQGIERLQKQLPKAAINAPKFKDNNGNISAN
jgi:hypothetical protein